MEHFFLSPYTAAHVGMLIQPLLTVSVASSLGTLAAAGEPKFDAGWSATEAPVTESSALGLIVIHYIAHNLLWLLHLWRALHPELHELVMQHTALWALLCIGFVGNTLCVLPAATRAVAGLSPEIDWLLMPVVTGANSFLLTRVCWSWLVCVQVIACGADWRVKALTLAWLVMDVTTLLVLRVATLPVLAITLLAAAWAYRRFGWRRASTGAIAASTQYSDVDAAPVARRKPKAPTTTAAAVDDESSSDSDGAGSVSVFEIGDTKDDIDERRRANAKRAGVQARSQPTPVKRSGSNVSI